MPAALQELVSAIVAVPSGEGLVEQVTTAQAPAVVSFRAFHSARLIT